MRSMFDHHGNEIPTEDNVIAALKRAVMFSPGRTFLDFSGEKYTFSDVDRLSNCFAHNLRDLGVRSNDRVVTLLDNSVDLITTWFAVNKLGAVWVPINTAYVGAFLRHQIVDAGARLIVCESKYEGRITDIIDGIGDLEAVIVRGTEDGDGSRGPLFRSLDDCRGSDATPIGHDPRHSDLACLIYTSGTTGPSKGCMISHNYICYSARTCIDSLPPLPNEIMWSPLPLFHLAALSGVVIRALLTHEAAAISTQFSVSKFWSEVEQSGAGTVMIVGAMYTMVADAPDTPEMLRCVGRLRAAAGPPITAEARKIWGSRFGVSLIDSYSYGQTECAKIATLSYGTPAAPPSSCGRAVDEVEVIIADEFDRPLPPDTPGEILYRPKRPYQCFSGYWNRPDATAEAWRNLWMHTGDLGRIDKEGFLYFVDRKKDYLRRRGENVSSYELEAAILEHPQVCDIAVHAVPSELTEDDIKITCVIEAGARIEHEELHAWCRSRLPKFALPRYIEFREKLPRNPVGRVLKFELRAEGVTKATWDAESVRVGR